MYEGLLRLGKDAPRYSADEAHVRLVVPVETQESFALFVAGEERRGQILELDDLDWCYARWHGVQYLIDGRQLRRSKSQSTRRWTDWYVFERRDT